MQGSPHDSPHDSPRAEPARATPDLAATGDDSEEENWAWYLYGVWRALDAEARALLDAAAAALATEPPDESPDQQPLELIASGELQALTRRVPLADFSPEAISAHGDDRAWLEQSARRHNAVVEVAQRERAILPAKFGSVYPRAEDVRAALLERHDALRDHLIWLDGCDEWAVHLYSELASLRRRAEQEQNQRQGDAGSAREQLAAASPGRAYFLRRKLADELADATERLLDDLIAQGLEAFARHARAAEVTRQLSGARLSQQDHEQDQQDQQDQGGAGVEVMLATLLVPRDAVEAFSADVAAFVQREPGLWSEQSGPWAPYSFAAVPAEPDAPDAPEGADVSEGFGGGA